MPDFTKRDGGTVHYDLAGDSDGPVIVLIEGLGAHMIAWRTEFRQPLLDAGYRVLRFDNRDVGLSQRYPAGGYSLSDLAEDTHQLIDYLGIGPTHVVGQSMGGMVAQHLAIEHPEDVASLSLIYTAPSADYVTGVDRPAAIRSAPRASSRDEAVKLHVEAERIGASTSYSWDESWKAEVGGLMWDRGYAPDGIARQCEALMKDRLDTAALAKIDVPVLILHGTVDALIPHPAGIALHAAIPGSDLWLIEGLGHDLPMELLPDITSRILANMQRDPRTLTSGESL